jgi:hypothetical protein
MTSSSIDGTTTTFKLPNKGNNLSNKGLPSSRTSKLHSSPIPLAHSFKYVLIKICYTHSEVALDLLIGNIKKVFHVFQVMCKRDDLLMVSSFLFHRFCLQLSKLSAQPLLHFSSLVKVDPGLLQLTRKSTFFPSVSPPHLDTVCYRSLHINSIEEAADKLRNIDKNE